MRRWSLVAVLCIGCVICPAASRAAESRFEPAGYQLGDSPVDGAGVPLWARETSTGWEPLASGTEVPRVPVDQIAWLRLPLPADPLRDPQMLVNGIDGACEIYVDGRRVFSNGEIVPNGHGRVSGTGATFIPLQEAWLGKHLFLRLQAVQSGNAGRVGLRDLRIASRGDLLLGLIRTGFPNLIIGALVFLQGLASLLIFFAWRRERSLLMFSAVALVEGVMCFTLPEVTGFIWPAPGFLSRILVVAFFFETPALALFVSIAFLPDTHRWFRRLFGALGVVAALLSIVQLSAPDVVSSLVLLYLVVAMVGQTICLVVAIREALRGSTEAGIFAIGLALRVMGVIYDSAITYSGSGTGFTSPWGILMLTLALSIIVARRFTRLQSTLEQHVKQLDERHVMVQALTGRLVVGARSLGDVVQRLRTSGEHHELGINQQSITLQEVVTTAGEIHQTSQLAAQKAASMLQAAADAEGVGRAGQEAVESSVGGLEAIRGEVIAMARAIRALDARTREIAGIVDTVKSLADQSNMLALNAAIEAVRSGEHGKGFVVVAREVRSLADQSIQATIRIREVLARVNEEIRAASSLSDRGEGRISASLTQVQSSGEQLRKLAEIVSSSSASVRQISAAVSQQSAGVSQVFVGLNSLSELMRQTVNRLEENKAAAASVQSVAEELSGLAGADPKAKAA